VASSIDGFQSDIGISSVPEIMACPPGEPLAVRRAYGLLILTMRLEPVYDGGLTTIMPGATPLAARCGLFSFQPHKKA